MKFSNSPFPLDDISQQNLQDVCTALWGWKICDGCRREEKCVLAECSWPRSSRLRKFFDFYTKVTAAYVPDLSPGCRPALQRHEDVCAIIRMLKSHPDLPRNQLTHTFFSQRDGRAVDHPQISDQHRAFDLAVKVMVMVNCAVDNQSTALLESGTVPLTWKSEKSLSQFVIEAFPSSSHGLLNQKDHYGRAPGVKALLTAKRLKRIAGLKFAATDDLGDHLRLDPSSGIVHIYHHTAFLAEQLIASQGEPKPMTVDQALRVGNLPRQLALEALDSLQRVLFPADPESQALLRSLVVKLYLDPDCLRFESTHYRSADEHEIEYHYFGARLMDLYEEILNPRPHGWIEKWAERRSGARHVMIATLIGVVIAVLLGLLALVVSVFQAWVSYQAWKHPVPG